MTRRKNPDPNHERDMIHELLFVRKDWKYGDPESSKYFAPVRALNDPKKSEDALNSAIADFQRIQGVGDWREIASGYEPRSYWYG